jgi:hypothetical protein
MKFFKKLLTGLGVIFCLLLLVFGFLAYLGSGFKGEQEAFVRQFMSDYSRHWDTSEVHDRLATEFLDQIQSPSGEQTVAVFRRLGRLLEVTDISLENFFAGTDGKSGVFVFKARFEAAPALVRLTIRDADGTVRVLGLHISPSTELAPLGSSPTET